MSSQRLLAILVVSLPLAALSSACSSDPEPAQPGSETMTPNEPPTTASASGTPLRDGVDPAIEEALTGAGIDIATLPDELHDALKDRAKTRAVMKTFTIALGVDCDGCHAPNAAGTDLDFEADTPKKKIARRMWKDFVRGLQRREGGGVLYCDGCHQGKSKFLERADDKGLRAWMKENFVAKLARRDGQEHSCATCHGDPFEGDILEKWQQ